MNHKSAEFKEVQVRPNLLILTNNEIGPKNFNIFLQVPLPAAKGARKGCKTTESQPRALGCNVLPVGTGFHSCLCSFLAVSVVPLNLRLHHVTPLLRTH